MTAYRWVSSFGYQLLPVAALFSVLRSSGVVGIDEKYMLVPKNDKPHEKRDTAISPRMSNAFDHQTWEVDAIYPKIWGCSPSMGKKS
jgi:hypothetical protein